MGSVDEQAATLATIATALAGIREVLDMHLECIKGLTATNEAQSRELEVLRDFKATQERLWAELKRGQHRRGVHY